MGKMDINEIHEILLEIIGHVHRILTNAGIHYYMLGGTMLGAVRHHGFIPWDDDIDIGVFREDFEKCKKILCEQLPARYRLRTIYNCEGIVGEIVKIEDSTTLVEEFGKNNKQINIGINIDIFPLDRARNNKNTLFSRNRLIHIVSRLNKSRLMPDSKLTKFFSPMLNFCLMFADKDFLLRVKRSLFPDDGHYIANYYGSWGVKEYIPEDVFGLGKLYQFENLFLYGVDKPDIYLQSLYGDYMIMPRENERHLHLVNAYKKSNCD